MSSLNLIEVNNSKVYATPDVQTDMVQVFARLVTKGGSALKLEMSFSIPGNYSVSTFTINGASGNYQEVIDVVVNAYGGFSRYACSLHTIHGIPDYDPGATPSNWRFLLIRTYIKDSPTSPPFQSGKLTLVLDDPDDISPTIA